MSKLDNERTGEMSMILSRIAFVWFNNPKLRLCQLVGNCFDAGDNYHKTDKELLERLKVTYPLGKGLEKDIDEMCEGMKDG